MIVVAGVGIAGAIVGALVIMAAGFGALSTARWSMDRALVAGLALLAAGTLVAVSAALTVTFWPGVS